MLFIQSTTDYSQRKILEDYTTLTRKSLTLRLDSLTLRRTIPLSALAGINITHIQVK